MGVSEVFARGVAMVGGAMILLRRHAADTAGQAVGTAPSIPTAKAPGQHPHPEDADRQGVASRPETPCRSGT